MAPTTIKRKKDTGEGGNGGQFGHTARAESDTNVPTTSSDPGQNTEPEYRIKKRQLRHVLNECADAAMSQEPASSRTPGRRLSEKMMMAEELYLDAAAENAEHCLDGLRSLGREHGASYMSIQPGSMDEFESGSREYMLPTPTFFREDGSRIDPESIDLYDSDDYNDWVNTDRSGDVSERILMAEDSDEIADKCEGLNRYDGDFIFHC